MSPSIDERTAWELVRAVPPGVAGQCIARAHNDPRPDVWLQVDGSGGWEASADVSPEARDVFDLYLPLQVQVGLVMAQLGQSLDGRIATGTGQSQYITGPADILRLHRLRALVDAVVVGAGTVALDNPRLTVRQVPGRNPVRVLLDPEGRLGPDRHVFSDGAARTIVVRRGPDDAPPAIAGDVVTMAVRDGLGFDPRTLLEVLRDQGYRRVLIEGGGITVSRFLAAGVVDRLHVTVAPMLIGSGRPALTLEPIASLDQALRPACRYFRLGDDILFDLDLRASKLPQRNN